eukprot:CAMPEP_0119194292 /NCGR_PEP_ID=MMETSP1316-20130426/4136_1 /TAXON_ID=41880 /ORGANISM="Pycnococcus provasolii, Strain RCC2336" /LENGTH=382 /DNA_ID=CAMNT_0007189613 /DNA_START=80 /DNA_END=1228 /DNA_ORIENTATION=+
MAYSQSRIRRPQSSSHSASAAATSSASVAARERWRARRPENQSGNIYVDHACIDCDTCRWLAPETFGRVNGKSAVVAQPEVGTEAHKRAMMALSACPTFSIHANAPPAGAVAAAAKAFPACVDPTRPDILHMGFHAATSFGATPYLVVRDQGGNFMVDCPRFDRGLAKRVEEAFGGVSYIVLTHIDDVADHEKWAAYFGAKRILHEAELDVASAKGGNAVGFFEQLHPGFVDRLEKVEVKLTGDGPWTLPDGGNDVEIIFTPGHSAGHVCVFHKPSKVLFTGDHLCGCGPKFPERYGQLYLLREFLEPVIWNVSEQIASLEKLVGMEFDTILPGHGRAHRYFTTSAKDDALETVIAFEKSRPVVENVEPNSQVLELTYDGVL